MIDADYVEPINSYSAAPDLIGEFLVRATGKSVRALYEEHITKPLGIPKHHLDTFRTPEIERDLANLYYRGPNSSFKKVDLSPYTTEDIPPPGHTIFACGALWGKLPAFTKVIQAILSEDTRLLSKNVWYIATRDDLGPRGLKVPSPELPYANPRISAT